MGLNLSKHFDKENLHHAYLIEGSRDLVLSELLGALRGLDINTEGNSDFVHISLDSFKIEDARNLRSYGLEKSFSAEKNAKKVFVISANSILLEAQNTMLKMFEEPIEGMHFFVIIPDSSALLRTFVSRFYLIKSENDENSVSLEEAEKFISMPLSSRIDFLKELLVEAEEDEEQAPQDSVRAKALRFLDALEVVICKKLENFAGSSHPSTGRSHTVQNFPVSCIEQMFKVREFLRQPGSSAKSLMESVAIVVPNFKS